MLYEQTHWLAQKEQAQEKLDILNGPLASLNKQRGNEQLHEQEKQEAQALLEEAEEHILEPEELAALEEQLAQFEKALPTKPPYKLPQRHFLTENTSTAFSDKGLAESVLIASREHLAKDSDTGAYYVFDGSIWHKQGKKKDILKIIVNMFLSSIVAEVQAAITLCDDDKQVKELQKFINRLERNATVTNVSQLCLSSPDLFIAATDYFDIAPHVLGTPSGLIDLESGMPLYGEDWNVSQSTSVTPVFMSDATDPLRVAKPQRFLGILKQQLANEIPLDEDNYDELKAEDEKRVQDELDYFQRILGSCLLGEQPKKILYIVSGTNTGKSMLFNGVIGEILGDYYQTTSSSNFVDSGFDKHDTWKEKLRNARCVVTSEVPQGKKLKAELLKGFVGGGFDPLDSRGMGMDESSYKPKYSVIMLANNEPVLDERDEALFNRFSILEFKHSIPPEEQDKDLAEKLLREEGGAILYWMMEGAALYLKCGLQEPESVQKRSRTFYEANSTVQQFLKSEYVQLFTDENTRNTDAFKSYQQFCNNESMPYLNKNDFYTEMKKLYKDSEKGKANVSYYKGLKCFLTPLAARN